MKPLRAFTRRFHINYDLFFSSSLAEDIEGTREKASYKVHRFFSRLRVQPVRERLYTVIAPILLLILS